MPPGFPIPLPGSYSQTTSTQRSFGASKRFVALFCLIPNANVYDAVIVSLSRSMEAVNFLASSGPLARAERLNSSISFIPRLRYMWL